VTPPTPPYVPVYVPPVPQTGGGGGAGALGFGPPAVPVAPQCDYALLHDPNAAEVKAIAAGVVEHFFDPKGGFSLVITADDGTRYFYAKLGCYVGKSGRRVKPGEVVAKMKGPAVPTVQLPAKPAVGLEGEKEALALPEAPKPTVVVPIYVASAPAPAPVPAPIPAPPPPAPLAKPQSIVPALIITGLVATGLVLVVALVLDDKPKRKRGKKKRRRRLRR
jgi:hypothetical protein